MIAAASILVSVVALTLAGLSIWYGRSAAATYRQIREIYEERAQHLARLTDRDGP